MSDTIRTGLCPFKVERPIMRHRWDQLTFLHWSYQPEDVQRLLPKGLVVDTYDGAAWVGLVPFLMEVRFKRGNALDWPFRFPETNVRTYVRDSEGEAGVWFLSLDSTRWGAVPVARSTYRVPYFWSEMAVARTGNRMTYELRRRWPKPRGVRSQVSVEIGERYREDELTEFDHYLTARWIVYGSWGGSILKAYAEHEPWALHRTTATYTDGLVAAAGLPAPEGSVVLHWSPGVDVLIGRPRRVRP
jgi:uncharacterized protein YqjF (DUF2071 family)